MQHPSPNLNIMVTRIYICLFAALGLTRMALAPDSSAPLVAVAVVFLCWAAASDIKTRQISNSLNLWFLASALAAVGGATLWGAVLARGGHGNVGLAGVASATTEPADLTRAAMAAAALFLGFWAVHLASPQGMGGGDVKLAPALGVVLGSVSWSAVWLGLMLAFLLNGLAAAVVILASRSAKQSIPFAPALGSGTLLALLL